MAKIQAFHRRLYRPTNGRTALDASFFNGDERRGGGIFERVPVHGVPKVNGFFEGYKMWSFQATTSRQAS